MNYILAGLFHPARKVRHPFWRVYNDMYVAIADSMIPYYPRLPEENLARDELYITI
jgi:splicing factor 3B subunit 1